MKEGTDVKASQHQYLIDLHSKHGTLTPDLVVADAKRKESPLHDLFEWDTKKAAMSHWHDVARALIRSVRVQVVNESRVITAPYFVRDPSLPSNVQGYTSTASLRSNSELARDAVAEECSRAAAAFRRAKEVAAAVGVDQDIEALLEQTTMLGKRVKQSA
jgi:hypothetical protein